MAMRRMSTRSAFVSLVAVLLLFGHLYQTAAAPLPASGKAYGTIDGRHLWQYVREQANIAERYRDQGHPQFWGRIAGTSGDLEDAQWVLTKYQRQARRYVTAGQIRSGPGGNRRSR